MPIIIVGELSYSQSKTFMINEAVRSLENELVQITDDINYKLDLCRKESELLLFDRQFNRILFTDYTKNINKLNEAYIDIIMPKFEVLRAMQTDIKVYTTNRSLLLGNKNILSIDEIKNNPLYDSIFLGNQRIVWLPVATLAKSTYINYTFYLIGDVDVATSSRASDHIVYDKVLTLSKRYMTAITIYRPSLMSTCPSVQ